MFPGGRMNPRQMKAAMKKMGIETEEFPDVEEVIIRTADKEYRITEANVTLMKVQGQETYQVVGETEVSDREASPDSGSEEALSEEDINLIMEQTGCSRERAERALGETGGEPAEAILNVMSE
ncbi:MAG: nascent polypeptide-associated complex protein [Methanomassiliicoccales archaeon]